MRRVVALLLLALLADPAAVAQTPEPESEQEPVPAAPSAGTVLLTAGALVPAPRLGRFRATLAPDPAAADRPPIAPADTSPEARLLRGWVAAGRAAGLAGVFYDNRDRGHSRLSPERFPQLSFLTYEPGLAERGFDRALARHVLFPGPTLGNASLAVTGGALARSLPRLAMTTPDGAAHAFVGYADGHLYVYPAHRDIGDLDMLPAALPYFIPTVGSSHSDRPFLDALALALASFRPETRARLEDEGLLAPTLNMLLRRSQRGVTDYAAPAAHPAAFARDRLRPAAMMAAAQALAPEDIPPLVQLEVEAESFAEAAGLAGMGERLFDTPAAVARLWRGWDWRRTMRVSAAGTRDPNGRALEFRWVLLSGDPERVRIAPLDAAGSRAEIEIDWHDAPFAGRPGQRPSARVEIAVLAFNGAQWSAPSFVTVAFPPHEARSWEPGPAGLPQLAAIDYAADPAEFPADPALWWRADWRDEAVRDAEGALVAWRRHHAGTVAEVGVETLGDSHAIERAGDGRMTLRWTGAP